MSLPPVRRPAIVEHRPGVPTLRIPKMPSSKLNARISHSVRASLHTTPLRGDILVGLKGRSSSGDIVHDKEGKRPIVVITPKKVLLATHKVVCAPLSSKLPTDRISAFEPVIKTSEETGLQFPSKAMINQLFTAHLEALKDKDIRKLGSARAFFPEIDNALKIVFDPNIKGKSSFSQGDIVRFKENEISVEGIIISNNLGNQMSRIAMISKLNQVPGPCSDYELIVTHQKEKIKINCQDIHTINQSQLEVIDHLSIKYLSAINKKLLMSVGIGETS